MSENITCTNCGEYVGSPVAHHIDDLTARAEAAEAKVNDAAKALKKAKGYIEGMMEEGCPLCNGDCSSANPPVLFCPWQIMQADLDQCNKALTKLRGEGEI